MPCCHYHSHRAGIQMNTSNRIREDGALSVLLGKMT